MCDQLVLFLNKTKNKHVPSLNQTVPVFKVISGVHVSLSCGMDSLKCLCVVELHYFHRTSSRMVFERNPTTADLNRLLTVNNQQVWANRHHSVLVTTGLDKSIIWSLQDEGKKQDREKLLRKILLFEPLWTCTCYSIHKKKTAKDFLFLSHEGKGHQSIWTWVIQRATSLLHSPEITSFLS